jgi:hypothetical protein
MFFPRMAEESFPDGGFGFRGFPKDPGRDRFREMSASEMLLAS